MKNNGGGGKEAFSENEVYNYGIEELKSLH
jgi:hypothetical protein